MAGVAQGRTVLRGCWFLFRTRKLLALGVLAAAAALGALVWPHDQALPAEIHFWCGGEESAARQIASYFGTWGDYLTYNVPLALAIWLYGAATRSSAWCRV